MTEAEIVKYAEKANMIVSGYAFMLCENGFISILSLYHPDCAMIVNKENEIIETNMDPIEQQIVLDLCKKNLKFMEKQNA